MINYRYFAAACAGAMMTAAGAASAQESTVPATEPLATNATTAAPTDVSATAMPAAASPAAGAGCELHVWPTENYVGMNSGLLSGFAVLGALADQAAHKNRVQTVKDLMRDYLGPEMQMDELNKVGITKTLKLDGYSVIVEPPTPFNEDVKKDPALKAKVKEMNARIKAGQRLSASTAPCYAELIGTVIFYQKAMFYGSNLFGGWVYRQFPATGNATKIKAGAVKNPLEDFPPKTPEKVDAAKAELRDAFAKDFVEYTAKKVFGSGAEASASGGK